MSELFEKLMKMNHDEIIAELDKYDEEDDGEFDEPLSAHETALHFMKNGYLTLDELDILMREKVFELSDETDREQQDD